ncbi:MAG: extracellular solute-binding protein [Candidatus Altiarchaeota archaeon]
MLSLIGCISPSSEKKNEVIVYTSRDKYFSEPILNDFEAQTGIKVKPVYDTGATKTAGLVNRIIAEKNNPQADVFWNSETGRTIVLKKNGLLSPYFSPNAVDVPGQYKDPEGYWTGFGARARVFIYNTNLLNPEELPESLFDLEKPEWNGRFCVGNGWLGTMATHNAALFLTLGDEKARQHFQNLKDNGVKMLVGNTAVRDAVSVGEVPLGIIDTSDAQEAISYGKPVAIAYPDQGENQVGVMLIPNTVALIKDGPNPENGRRFIDYMLSREMEERLAFMESSQIPLKQGVPTPDHVKTAGELKVMEVDFSKVADKMDESNKFLLDLFTG